MLFSSKTGLKKDLLLAHADTRIMVHVADAAKEFNTITIRSVDSDVVVLAIYAYAQLATALWMGFGTGKTIGLFLHTTFILHLVGRNL